MTKQKRHYRIGETVRVVTGNTGDTLPRVTVLERRGEGRTRRGAPQYRVQRQDDGSIFWTSGSNLHTDTPATEGWAQALARIDEVYAAKQAAVDAAVAKVSADFQPLVDEAYAANRDAAGAAVADDLYRSDFR